MPGKEPNLDPIAAAAAEAEDAAADQRGEVENPRLAALEERLAGIEPLLEQLQANAALSTALSNYVGDLRDEQKFFNKARYAVGIIALVAALFLLWLLRDSIYNPKSPLLTSPPAAIAAFVIGLVSGIVLLISAFTKGVFRSTVERHADGFLPPTLEKGLEVIGKFVGK